MRVGTGRWACNWPRYPIPRRRWTTPRTSRGGRKRVGHPAEGRRRDDRKASIYFGDARSSAGVDKGGVTLTKPSRSSDASWTPSARRPVRHRTPVPSRSQTTTRSFGRRTVSSTWSYGRPSPMLPVCGERWTASTAWRGKVPTMRTHRPIASLARGTLARASMHKLLYANRTQHSWRWPRSWTAFRKSFESSSGMHLPINPLEEQLFTLRNEKIGSTTRAPTMVASTQTVVQHRRSWGGARAHPELSRRQRRRLRE